ncbi:UDP-4-amino-4,6-dideoxy-N-acetyl-beta-L-altrosamine transaminase [Qipengyuania flava]|uniref:UDP-4-amino-4, 6-dideoxy-N-acetyl-beta-L-altrosamine transaminase n=1 Tax=Qipengyuania flava TaxID=192812 RepID=UPI003BAE92B1
MIPYGRQSISQADIDAVVEVLKSDFLTQGPAVTSFEQALATKAGAKHAIAMSNATAALHVACLALDLGPGDRLWTTPITFVASANCGRYCGATIDFVDINPQTFNMCSDALEQKLKQAEQDGTLPKVIVAVHMGGQSPRMERIAELARAYDIRIIEDASHAIGASYLGQPVGAGAYADITVFSFHPVKIITAGEGGAALTNDANLAERMERLRSHGITRDQKLMVDESEGPWYYQQLELGLNYRMTDIQAALGLCQLTRLDKFVARRREIADAYDAALADVALDVPGRLPGAESSWHLYVIRLHDQSRHRQAFEGLRANGIGVNLHYIPVHLQPYYRQFGFGPGDFPASENYYARAISVPMYPDLTDEMQAIVVAAVTEVIG